MAKQKTYKQLFRVGEPVEVAHAPREGESEPEWMLGRVVKITTRLHAAFPDVDREMAYDRAMYNRGEIRHVAPKVATTAEGEPAVPQASNDRIIARCRLEGAIDRGLKVADAVELYRAMERSLLISYIADAIESPSATRSEAATEDSAAVTSDMSIPIAHVDIQQLRPEDFDGTSCVRLYSTASVATHGRDNARYALQIFGRQRVRAYVATASLGVEALRRLGAAVGAAIRDIEGIL